MEPDIEELTVDGFRGLVVARYRSLEPAEIKRLSDPGSAVETIHWGRNYLYRTQLKTSDGPLDVVVKVFRTQGFWSRLRYRLAGSKAARSWRAALAFQAAGVATAEPILVLEPATPEGPSLFVSRYLDGTLEARYLLRAVNQGRAGEDFPAIDVPAFLANLGRTLRGMHEAGLFHRDLSIGNVLLSGDGDGGRLFLIDLNRSRLVGRLSLSQRCRDLCRLAIFKPDDQRRFLRAYWGSERVGPLRTAIYLLYHHGFRAKIAAKKRWRGVGKALRDWILPRRAHVHIPAAPSGASMRDKSVWDPLSDQPHQHAGRLEKTMIRLGDSGSHVRQTFTCLAAAPRIWRQYRALRQELYARPVPWDGVGVAVRPDAERNDALLAALDDLGVRHILLRLHPWEGTYDAEEALARELRERGYDLAFALPQNRELVRDPTRWRAQVEEIAERFVPLGRHFQVGQAINRSKWGVWTYNEYLALARSAIEVLHRHDGVEVLGPAVIDFEFQTTAAVLNLPGVGFRFDAVASLLYVDRRGAPENRQLGFDTVGKVMLLKAIADTARNSAPRSWITEVNWPLREGPHSPAGRSVAVSEETQADYLARFFLLALTTGMVERVYWWQLVARGYGLTVPLEDRRLHRRPSFSALATLNRELRGATFLGPLPSAEGAHLFRFRRQDGKEVIAAWTTGERQRVTLPRPAVRVVQRGGESEEGPVGPEIEVGSAVQYFELSS